MVEIVRAFDWVINQGLVSITVRLQSYQHI